MFFAPPAPPPSLPPLPADVRVEAPAPLRLPAPPPLVLPPPRPRAAVDLGLHRPERRLKPRTALLLRAALEILVAANGGTVTHRPEPSPPLPPSQP